MFLEMCLILSCHHTAVPVNDTPDNNMINQAVIDSFFSAVRGQMGFISSYFLSPVFYHFYNLSFSFQDLG